MCRKNVWKEITKIVTVVLDWRNYVLFFFQHFEYFLKFSIMNAYSFVIFHFIDFTFKETIHWWFESVLSI